MQQQFVPVGLDQLVERGFRHDRSVPRVFGVIRKQYRKGDTMHQHSIAGRAGLPPRLGRQGPRPGDELPRRRHCRDTLRRERIDGIEAYREFLARVRRAAPPPDEMIAAFGDEGMALLMYDAETIPAKRRTGGRECVTVRDGKIVYNRFVFDRTPFDEFRRRQA